MIMKRVCYNSCFLCVCLFFCFFCFWKLNRPCGDRNAHAEPSKAPEWGSVLTDGHKKIWRRYPITHLNVSGLIFIVCELFTPKRQHKLTEGYFLPLLGSCVAINCYLCLINPPPPQTAYYWSNRTLYLLVVFFFIFTFPKVIWVVVVWMRLAWK